MSLPLKTDGTLHKIKGCRALYVGTPCWSAPEVLLGEECLGAIITSKADIFSYGLVLWEMMTLSLPNTPTAINDTYYTGISDDMDDRLGNYIRPKSKQLFVVSKQLLITNCILYYR